MICSPTILRSNNIKLYYNITEDAVTTVAIPPTATTGISNMLHDGKL